MKKGGWDKVWLFNNIPNGLVDCIVNMVQQGLAILFDGRPSHPPFSPVDSKFSIAGEKHLLLMGKGLSVYVSNSIKIWK